MSHHKEIVIDGKKCGHVRITNSGIILSVWVKTDKQQMLFVPEQAFPIDYVRKWEEEE
jgi:hypothetical protein